MAKTNVKNLLSFKNINKERPTADSAFVVLTEIFNLEKKKIKSLFGVGRLFWIHNVTCVQGMHYSM